MFKALGAILAGFLGSLWSTWFPAKTASEQKADDNNAALTEANDARNKVNLESRADVDADLSKFVQR